MLMIKTDKNKILTKTKHTHTQRGLLRGKMKTIKWNGSMIISLLGRIWKEQLYLRLITKSFHLNGGAEK